MSTEVNRDLRNTMILPTLTNVSEGQKWNEAEQLKVNADEMNCLRPDSRVTTLETP